MYRLYAVLNFNYYGFMSVLKIIWFLIKGFFKSLFKSLFWSKKQDSQFAKLKQKPKPQIKSKRKREQLKKLDVQYTEEIKSAKKDVAKEVKTEEPKQILEPKAKPKPIINLESIEDISGLEETLVAADIDYVIVEDILKKVKNIKPKEDQINLIRKELESIITPCEARFDLKHTSPHVTLVFGVNGSGKTTTIGKLAFKYANEGKKVLLIACDTFRAAASEQLKELALRAGAQIEHQNKENEDPAAVCFRGLQKAKDEGFDIVIIDTSGRQQTNANLMEELRKIERIIKKQISIAPHESLLVLDGSSGMGAVRQVEAFLNCVEISGIIVTKLDGMSKGGGIFSIAKKYKKNIYFTCNGEGRADISNFDAKVFLQKII